MNWKIQRNPIKDSQHSLLWPVLQVWCNTSHRIRKFLSITQKLWALNKHSLQSTKIPKIPRLNCVSDFLFAFCLSVEVQLNTQMSDLTCRNPNVFVSHICFIFQKNGCSHFWQESLSSHWGAYKTKDMKAIRILSAKEVCFKNPQWSFIWKSAILALDFNTADYLGYSTRKLVQNTNKTQTESQVLQFVTKSYAPPTVFKPKAICDKKINSNTQRLQLWLPRQFPMPCVI